MVEDSLDAAAPLSYPEENLMCGMADSDLRFADLRLVAEGGDAIPQLSSDETAFVVGLACSLDEKPGSNWV